MPERQTLQRARRDKRQGKAASTQAGEFIREEIHHVREGVHGARSTRQAIAIGLSKARRAGVDLKPPSASRATPSTRRSAERGHGTAASRRSTPKRSQSSLRALRGEGKSAATPRAISRQARSAASRRSPGQGSAAARRAATTRARRSGRSAGHAPA